MRRLNRRRYCCAGCAREAAVDHLLAYLLRLDLLRLGKLVDELLIVTEAELD